MCVKSADVEHVAVSIRGAVVTIALEVFSFDLSMLLFSLRIGMCREQGQQLVTSRRGLGLQGWDKIQNGLCRAYLSLVVVLFEHPSGGLLCRISSDVFRFEILCEGWRGKDKRRTAADDVFD